MKTTTTNNLRYSTSKTVGKETIYVNIRLNDECKNGHEDFSITGDIYEAGKPKTDRYHISGGCIHKDILKRFPEFKIFIDLHLSDFKGIPMYAIENGFYHLKNSPEEVTMDHLRISKDEFNKIKVAEDKEYFTFLVYKLGLIKRWEAEAKEAIELLESLTGEKFKASGKSRNIKIDNSLIDETEIKIQSGYYTPEKIAERAEQAKKEAKEKAINKIVSEARKEIEKIEKERDIKLYILSKGLSIKNFIFYNHTNEGVFNWNDYENKITLQEFESFIKNADLPLNVTFKLK